MNSKNIILSLSKNKKTKTKNKQTNKKTRNKSRTKKKKKKKQNKKTLNQRVYILIENYKGFTAKFNNLKKNVNSGI